MVASALPSLICANGFQPQWKNDNNVLSECQLWQQSYPSTWSANLLELSQATGCPLSVARPYLTAEGACLLPRLNHTAKPYQVIIGAWVEGVAVVRPEEPILIIVKPAPTSD